MALVLSIREVANFAQCSEVELRQAIADGHTFHTLADAARHFERKRPDKAARIALKEAAVE